MPEAAVQKTLSLQDYQSMFYLENKLVLYQTFQSHTYPTNGKKDKVHEDLIPVPYT
jgi:hypothetical protein